jgi:cellulose synthase (UDP-forming)
MAVIALTALGLLYATLLVLLGSNLNLNGLITNMFWGLNNILAMSGMVYSAFWKPEEIDVRSDI